MKYFAQFWGLSSGYAAGTIPPKFENSARRLIEACGPDSVLPLDGRLSLANMMKQAREVAKARGHIGFSIRRGDFRTSREAHGYTPVDRGPAQ